MLHATEDVEVALSRFVESRSEAEVLVRQIAALARARDKAETAYEGGVLPLLSVLEADRNLLAARGRLATTNPNKARAVLASFRALGGDLISTQVHRRPTPSNNICVQTG